jgi:hypothetical protein
MKNARMMATIRQLMFVALLLGAGVHLWGQKTSSSQRGSMVYENHNQTDYKALTLRAVTGRAHDEQRMPIPKVSLGLFTERDHELVTVVESADDGTFAFTNVEPGLYRLVAKYDGFCPANAPIEVSRHASASREIDLHMKPAGLDTCSYGTAGPKASATAGTANGSGGWPRSR